MNVGERIARRGQLIKRALDEARQRDGDAKGRESALATIHGAATHLAELYGPLVAFEILTDAAEGFLGDGMGWRK